MVNVQAGIEKVKEDFHRMIPQEVILQGCRHVGHEYRQRQCGPVETFYLFLLRILHGNIACSALRHLGGMACSIVAYGNARMRLPLGLLRTLLSWASRALENLTTDAPRWLGHRVFHVDGSSFSMPDTPALQQTFGQPGGQKPGGGFPVAHLLAMFDAATGRIVDVLAAPLRTHEMSRIALVYNLVCGVIYQAARRQGLPPDRISFVDALRWLRAWQPGKILIELLVNPSRPGRVEPREIKRRPKQYKRMTEPRAKRLMEKIDAA